MLQQPRIHVYIGIRLGPGVVLGIRINRESHVGRAVVPPNRLGVAYENVSFTTSDGLKLEGWYVPSKNGAAVIAFPGRNGSQRQTRMLARHGYGVLLRIQQLAKGNLQIEQGSLYPALYRLEHKGFIESEWGESDNNRKAKFYRLTPAGKRQLRLEAESWKRHGDMIAAFLSAVPEEL